MPHIILEYSDNIIEKKFTDLFIDIQNILVEKLPTKLEACKSRAIICDDYVLGDNNPQNAFVHISIKILSGRDDSLLCETSETILRLMNDFFKESKNKTNLSLSVFIEDLPNTYRK